ncbi:MAG: UDP-2,3-diacylglucosamine diphosphatase LpxI, partial [Opitutales bacterium]|nr:UDP-2,3-diacylglucosamine diphosphatase LpxI [Opitutales bacterium]
MGRFLPVAFDPKSATIAIIAGRGEYPLLLAQRVKARGINCRLIALEGEASEELQALFSKSEQAKANVGQLGKVLRLLKSFRATDVLMAGQIRPMRLFHGLKLDLLSFRLLQKLKERNAQTLFSTVCEQIEASGIRVLDARSFMEEDLVVRAKKFPVDRDALEHGIRIATEVARLEIGQSVIVKNGTVLCVEGFDGTDAMLRRAKELKLEGMLFVKTSKVRHDFRFDVPIFGMTTLRLLREANIRAAALKSGETIILRQKEVLSQAKKMG